MKVYYFYIGILYYLTHSATLCLGQFGARIITDLQVIESSHGVPVDLSYNETNRGYGTLNSVPGCPKSIEGHPWVYFGTPPRCFLVSTQGPCPNSRVLFLERGTPFGVCSCECFIYLMDNGIPVLSSGDGRYSFCGRGSIDQVHDHVHKTCYNLQEKGPCGPNQWLVKNPPGTSVTCVKECSQGQFGPMYFDHITGNCIDGTGGFGDLGGRAGPVILTDCPLGKKYSSTLKRCVSVRPHNSLVVG